MDWRDLENFLLTTYILGGCHQMRATNPSFITIETLRHTGRQAGRLLAGCKKEILNFTQPAARQPGCAACKTWPLL